MIVRIIPSTKVQLISISRFAFRLITRRRSLRTILVVRLVLLDARKRAVEISLPVRGCC
jgi:hypothetical protein